jgi:hypothetical protein
LDTLERQSNVKIAQIKTTELDADVMTNKIDADKESVIVKNHTVLDRVGVWVTSLCAIHCLLLPILLPLAPLIASSFVASAWFERAIFTASILIGFAALFIGFQKYHRQLYPFYSLTLGGLVYWNKHIFGDAYEPLVVVIGAVFIVAAHLINLRLCKKCKQCETC